MSDIRVAPEEAIKNISIEEVEEAIKLVGKLYEECFGNKLERNQKQIETEDIIRTFFWM